MKVGVSSYAFRWATNREYLQATDPLDSIGLIYKAASMGAEIVQLCENLPLLDMTAQELRDVRAAADVNSVDLELGFKGLTEEKLRRVSDICTVLRTDLVRVIVNDGGICSPSEAVVDFLKVHGGILFEKGIRLALENHFHYTPQELKYVIESVGEEQLGICLDPINSLSIFASPNEAIRDLAGYAFCLHVKDADITRQDTGFYIYGTEIGKGRLRVDELLRTVSMNGHDPSLLVESWMDDIPGEKETLAQEEKWIYNGIQFIRRTI